MKEKKTEELYIRLSEVDDRLLREAEETDSREKLYPKTATVLAAPQKKHRGVVFRTVAILAACLAVAITAAVVVPLLKKDPGSVPVTPAGTVRIDSMDALNYYGAQYLRARSAGNGTKTVKASFADAGFRLLALEDEPMVVVPVPEKEEELPKEELPKEELPKEEPPKEENSVFEIPQSNPEPPEDTPVKYDAEKGYYYYEFDPNDAFTMTGAIGFRIRLTDPNGFLAQKLGTGIIDVVLTQNSFENMITFRSQDGRYFSCLSGDSKEGYLQYVDGKYIDGYRVIKKDTGSVVNGNAVDYSNQVLYQFSVRMENGLAVGFESSYYYEDLTAYALPIDTAEFVEGSAYAAEGEVTVTVKELEEFAKDLPAEDKEGTESRELFALHKKAAGPKTCRFFW